MKIIICIYSIALFFAFSCCIASGQVITFGRTSARVGSNEETATQETSFFLWSNLINYGAGIQLGGIRYNVSVVTYNDASDPQLIGILYDRLISVDKVDFLFAPFYPTNVDIAYAIAEANNIPMIDPNPGFGSSLLLNWTFQIYPASNKQPSNCINLFASLGAKTAVIGCSANLLVGAVNSSLLQNNMTLLSNDVISDDDSVVSELVAKWKQLKPDVFIGAADTSATTASVLLAEMSKASFFPKANYLLNIPSDPTFRSAAGWQAVYSFGTAVWDVSLNFSDPLFGSSAAFARNFLLIIDQIPVDTDAAAAAAGVVFYDALMRAGSINRTAVRNALIQTELSTVFGRVQFDSTHATVSSYGCFQVQLNDSFLVVAPLSYPGIVKAAYPGFPPIPPDFFSHDYTLRNALIIGGCALLVVILSLVGVGLFIKARYHVIFLPREEDKVEFLMF